MITCCWLLPGELRDFAEFFEHRWALSCVHTVCSATVEIRGGTCFHDASRKGEARALS